MRHACGICEWPVTIYLPWKIIFSTVAIEAAILVVQKERPGETGDWKQPLRLACYVSVWHMIHFGGHFTLFAQRDQEFATMNFLIARQLFTTRRVWYEFSIFLPSDYKKRWWDLYITPRTEYWILVSQVECWLFMRAQFSRTSNHVQCWEFKLTYSL